MRAFFQCVWHHNQFVRDVAHLSCIKESIFFAFLAKVFAAMLLLVVALLMQQAEAEVREEKKKKKKKKRERERERWRSAHCLLPTDKGVSCRE